MHDIPSLDAPATGGLERALQSGRFVVTAEVAPPASGDAKTLLERAQPLRGLADAVNVTDGAGARVAMCSLAAAAVLVRNGIEPILQLTCRDRNRIALQSDIIGSAALGVRNFLFLRGDDPRAGDEPDAAPVFDLDARELMRIATAMTEQSKLRSGRPVTDMPGLFVGAADMPIDPPAGWKPDGLQAKANAGARFAQTQFCMDIDVVGRYVRRLGEAGLDGRIHLIIGIAPLRSARSARWMREHLFGTIIPDPIVARMERARDEKAEGVAICVELLEQLCALPGVAGAHIMSPGGGAEIAAAIAAFKSTSAGKMAR